jgi:hypothetical protein
MEIEIRTDLPAKVGRKAKYAPVGEPHKTGFSLSGSTPNPVKAPIEEQTSASTNAPLVELEVLRIPPNPRLVICRYRILGEEKRCMVRVGRNSNFVPRMKFSLEEPSDPVARAKPWEYSGPLPRRRGRW